GAFVLCEHPLHVKEDGAGTAKGTNPLSAKLGELPVRDGEDHGIISARWRGAFVDRESQFTFRPDNVDLRVPDFDLGIVFLQSGDHIKDLRVAQIRTILLEGDAE